MSSPLRAVNALSVFWESFAPVVSFSIYEAELFSCSNYSPQSCVHVSDDTDKTSRPQHRHEPEFMHKYAARDQQKSRGQTGV